MSFKDRLNQVLEDSQVIIDLGEDYLDIKPGFGTIKEFKEFLSEGAVLNINKLMSTSLLIPPGDYLVWTTNSNTTQLLPLSDDKVQSELVQKTPYFEVMTSKLVNNWNKVDRFIGEASSTSVFQSKHPGRIHQIDTRVANPVNASGKSQEQIADEMGVDPSTVSRWMTTGEKSGRNPTLKHAGELSSIVGAAPESMFRELDTASTSKVKRKKQKTGGSGGGRNKKISGK